MTNCFYIGLPNRYNVSECSDSDYSALTPCCGIRTGYRHHRYMSENVSSSWNVSWYMPTYQEVDYLYISRADCLQNVNEIVLESSPDNIVWTPEITLSSPLVLTGPREEDLMVRFDTITSPYYRVRIEYAINSQTIFNKLYLGKLLDLGIMPKTTLSESRQQLFNRRSRTTSGKTVAYSNKHPVYEYTIEWEGVDDEKTAEFVDRIPFRGNRYCILYSEDGRGILNGHQTLHGIIDRVQVDSTADNLNTIEFRFIEMKG